MSQSFEDFIKSDKWSSLNEHYNNFNSSLSKNIESNFNHAQRDIIREKLISKIKTVDNNLMEKMKKELLTGNVVAIDGTCTDYDLLNVGFQARIGIIAINYKNVKNDYAIYVSEPFIPYNKKDYNEILEFAIKKKKGKVGITKLHITAIMLYKEREIILDRPEKYKMVQGDIFPYELKTGQGKLKGLTSCINLGKKLLNSENMIATQSTTKDPVFRILGNALNSGEYIEIMDYYDELNEFLHGDEYDYSVAARFNPGDKDKFQSFIDESKNKYSIGIYKASKSKRSYVFYAPKNNLEEMVNLLFADSSFQPIRGFPLLLDYADSICSRLLSSEDFKKQIEYKLARKNILEIEISEKSTRRR